MLQAPDIPWEMVIQRGAPGNGLKRPRVIATSWGSHNFNFTMVYGTYNELVTRVYHNELVTRVYNNELVARVYKPTFTSRSGAHIVGTVMAMRR